MLIITNLNVRCIKTNIFYDSFYKHRGEVVAFVRTWPSSWIVGIRKCSSNTTIWAFWSWRFVVRSCQLTHWDATRPSPCWGYIHPHNLNVWFHNWQRRSRWWMMSISLQKMHHPFWQWFATTMNK